MMTTIHLIILIAIVSGLIALVAIGLACRARDWRVRVVLIVAGLLFSSPGVFVTMALYPGIFDSRFKTYQAFYEDIRPGMTRDEVLNSMAKHYPKGGKRKPPQIRSDSDSDLGFFMNPETSTEPNCEGIFLNMESGKVVKKTYSPD